LSLLFEAGLFRTLTKGGLGAKKWWQSVSSVGLVLAVRVSWKSFPRQISVP